MFGLTNSEGNHGEDVKEYWFYLDSTPDALLPEVPVQVPAAGVPLRGPGRHQRAPRQAGHGVRAARHRRSSTRTATSTWSSSTPRARHDDILMLVTAHNRGPERGDAAPAADAVVPQHVVVGRRASTSPSLTADGDGAARAVHPELGEWRLRADASAQLLFCENETNNERLFGAPERLAVRQGRDQRLRRRRRAGAVNPARTGTKVRRPPRARDRAGRERVDPRAPDRAPATGRRRSAPTSIAVLDARRDEADEFYATVIPPTLDADAALVMRQALAGLLWGKQYYEYDVHRWLREHGVNPWDPNAPASSVRNVPWFHMVAGDVISMPDKWEYPWFAAWDLAFHCAPLSLVDVDFAKEQVELLLQHPLPAPQRPDPGLRVELQRRQPAGDGVGGAVRLRARGGDPRRGRPRVPRARVRAAADQLHLVGQPQGPRRPQPLPGRVPRPRQHRHLRPLGAAARRRHARAGRRHGVDGALLPVDAADRGRAGHATTRPTATWR